MAEENKFKHKLKIEMSYPEMNRDTELIPFTNINSKQRDLNVEYKIENSYKIKQKIQMT